LLCLKRIIVFFKIKILIMPDKKQPGKLVEMPRPEKQPEVNKPFDPAEPIIPEEEPEIIPDEDPFENPPPNEMPEPGEGP
jgi:hypothetical protein